MNQVLGDGIMALFGAPTSYEDHALRACSAALAMQESVAALAKDIERRHGVCPQIRVGLSSGEVVVRSVISDIQLDCSAVGETTHLAARVEQLAEPGTVTITMATLGLVEGMVEVQALGPTSIKGQVGR